VSSQKAKHDNSIVADSDSAFIKRDEVRGLRLHLDYLKPELLMREYGIESTIIVFGSARIKEPEEAEKNLQTARQNLQASPDDHTLQREVTVAKNMLKKSTYYTIAREFGRLVGCSGKGSHDCRITLMTGGGPGIMEAANRGAHDVGSKSIGINISLPYEQHPNPYITPELSFQTHYFAIRKLHLLRRAKAIVIFAGGFGTLDELFESLTLIQTGTIQPLPVIIIGKAFWEKVIDFNFLADEGVIDGADTDLFSYASTAQEAWETILAWYKERGLSF
jgi:uncharacterized protein (TIGR00730 family)